jgi:uncharacterized protein (DUF305 family)
LRPARVATAALAALGVFAGCGSAGPASAPAPRSAAPADRAFLRDSLSNHSGAVQIALVAEQQSEHQEARRLAQQIEVTQTDEIDLMNRLIARLSGRPVKPRLPLAPDAPGSGGPASRLLGAHPFDRGFIAAMSVRQRRAISLARAELEAGRDPAVRALAGRVVAAQARQLADMGRWARRWYKR